VHPQRTEWGITVKAIAEGVAEDGSTVPSGEVSNYLHTNVFEGDVLTVSLPFGDLVLDDSSDPLLLISAGIGCTPIIGMLHYLTRTETDRHVTVLHADGAPPRHAHARSFPSSSNGCPAPRYTTGTKTSA
jgi:nitric oxide dioxygenase